MKASTLISKLQKAMKLSPDGDCDVVLSGEWNNYLNSVFFFTSGTDISTDKEVSNFVFLDDADWDGVGMSDVYGPKGVLL